MGSINIEGIGIVALEGDDPNEIEHSAIVGSLGQDDEEPEAPPVPQTLDEEVAGFKEQNVVNQQNNLDAEVEGFKQTNTANQERVTQDGLLGVMPTSARREVREVVENQHGLLQFIAEASPSIAGAVRGTAAGARFGPPGMLAGGITGGIFGEALGQETGVSPRSDLNLGLAAGGPILGPVIGKGIQLGKKAIGLAARNIPFAKVARAKNTQSSVVEEFESLGTRILAKQKGLLARKSGDLYKAVRKSGVIIPGKDLDNSRAAIVGLMKEMEGTKSFPEVLEAFNHLKKVLETITPGKASTTLDNAGNPIPVSNEISIDTLVAVRQQMGTAIRRAEAQGGIKLGSAKKAFATISDDLDKIANSPSLGRRAARLAQAAVKRAKLEFSVKDMEMSVARFTKDTKNKDGVAIDISGVNKWLREVTNPKHKQFNKNFTESMKDEIPAIKKRLAELNKILGVSASGGPGSLIIRGRLTSTMVGMLSGFGLGGPLAGAAGAMIGTNFPEMLTSMLTTKAGAKMLEAAARAGSGSINMKSWVAAGQAATRSVGERNEQKRKKNEDK
tara:strand:+ start:68 stop:1744 length:1677 start_codon:yes stop_codon:yes gene_type:complete